MAWLSMNQNTLRKSVLFVVGILGVAHETLVSNSERPTLLLLFAAMVGLPAFLSHDERNDAAKKFKEEDQ